MSRSRARRDPIRAAWNERRAWLYGARDALGRAWVAAPRRTGHRHWLHYHADENGDGVARRHTYAGPAIYLNTFDTHNVPCQAWARGRDLTPQAASPCAASGGPRSCQTYLPAVRHNVRFEHADALGRSLDADAYAERYCSCSFCLGAFEAGQHPLDLLLESDLVPAGKGAERPTPTSRAVSVNTWHYLLSRRQEVDAFSVNPAAHVIDRDISRAAALTGGHDTGRLRRLADELQAA